MPGSGLHPSIRDIPMPARLQRLPLTEQGFPTLFFAPAKDGKAIIRSVDLEKFRRCIEHRLCWLFWRAPGPADDLRRQRRERLHQNHIGATLPSPMCGLRDAGLSVHHQSEPAISDR